LEQSVSLPHRIGRLSISSVLAINIFPQLYVTETRRRQLNSTNAINYAKFFSRSHNAVIRVYDEAAV
jgi:hypothetical protein